VAEFFVAPRSIAAGFSADFDAQASDLGIAPGNTYQMDIFHAERHTNDSNFRVETNIKCFVPVPDVPR